MTKIKITVTKEILEKSKFSGRLGSGADRTVGMNCAVALAIRGLFPNVWVSVDKINFYKSYEGVLNAGMKPYAVSFLPKEASNFISTFDGSSPYIREKMAQISFEIEIPDAVIEDISIDELNQALVGSTTMELV